MCFTKGFRHFWLSGGGIGLPMSHFTLLPGCVAHRIVDATTREASNMGMKRILAALLLLTLAAPASGQDFERGLRAYFARLPSRVVL